MDVGFKFAIVQNIEMPSWVCATRLWRSEQILYHSHRRGLPIHPLFPVFAYPSMGLTPLEGLMMGTRCGDIDPSIHHYLLERGYDEKYISTMLTKKAGLVGISGKGDFRDVCDGHAKGDAICTLAFNMYCYRVRKYVGAYMAVLGGRVDAIVFTAGVGENSSRMTFARCLCVYLCSCNEVLGGGE